MTYTDDISLSSSKHNAKPKCHVNWHEAASCAIQIELRDYADILDFQPEFILGKNSYRIDLLVIKKLSNQFIPKNIAHIFKTYNLFEIKGIHSSVTVNSYYKTIGYTGLFIDQISNTAQYTSLNISITFLTFRYPRKLIKHLRDERNLVVEKSAPGIYHIHKETFKTQIIVISELSPEEYLYLRCLTDNLKDISLISRLADDYALHKDFDIYTKYLNQLTTANLKTKGESSMVCEGLFNLFGTTSEEVIARAKEESKQEIDKLSSSNQTLSSQIDYLKNLLIQNNIAFDLNSISNKTDMPNQ
ncbi:MAG: hypothetical protein K2J99_08835 [Lachnospiraceae bacterium]|nr:hypothetical protein [Lachnospiraceae bacterium]